jgi:hypothetical protein
VLKEALEATTNVQTGKGVWSIEPDHYARMKAVQQLTRLLQAGAAGSRSVDGGDDGRSGWWTWEQFTQVYAEIKQRGQMTHVKH